MSIERLLKEYILLLVEDEGGDHAGYTAGDIMSAGAGMNPYGVHYGSSDDLYKVFIKPFTDVADTAAGKTKEMSQRTQTLLKVAFETVATTVVPILRDDYAKIFAKEKKEIDKIRKQYSTVYKSNWDAFLDNDVLTAAFFYSPVAFLTAAFVRKSPKQAAQLVGILSGGSLDGYIDKVSKKLGWNEKPSTGLGGHHSKRDHEGPGSIMDGQIREDGDSAAEQQPDPAKYLVNDKVKARLEKSDVVQKMQTAGQAIVRGTLSGVYKHAQNVMSAHTLQDLQNKTGVHLKGMDKLAEVPQQERQKAEGELLKGTKDSMRAFYVKNLEAQVQDAVKSGVPQDSAYVRDYTGVIAKIKAL